MIGAPAREPAFATFGEMLAAAAGRPGKLVFVDAQERETPLSSAELRTRAREVAAALKERGVERGDRVAMLLPTSPAFVACFFGASLAGAVPVPLYPPVRLGRLDEFHRRTAAMLQASGARLVIADARFHRLLGEAVLRARPALGLVTVDRLTSNDAYEAPVRAEELAFIQFSSGTTVDPKPVALSHRNVLSNVEAFDGVLEEAGGWRRGVSWLPLYHDMGLIGSLVDSIYRAACGRAATEPVFLGPELFLAKPGLWLRLMSKHKGEISVAPNFAFGLCLKRMKDEEIAALDLSHVRFLLSGAEPVVASVLRRFLERFAPAGLRPDVLMPVYGLSEATLAVTFRPPRSSLRTCHIDPNRAALEGVIADGTREVVSVGKPLPGIEVEVRDEQGRALPERQVGRIHVRSPGVMTGYFGRPDATAQAIQDGWLDTGDLGFVLDGELHVSGRAKDVVILRGANHPPQVFEECLEGVSGVRAGCVAAIGFQPADAAGEELALLVETDGVPPADLRERILGLVAEATGIRPHTVELLAAGTLPRTSSGKLRRMEAARQWLAGELRPPKDVTTLGLALEFAKGQVQLLRARLPAGDAQE